MTVKQRLRIRKKCFIGLSDNLHHIFYKKFMIKSGSLSCGILILPCLHRPKKREVLILTLGAPNLCPTMVIKSKPWNLTCIPKNCVQKHSMKTTFNGSQLSPHRSTLFLCPKNSVNIPRQPLHNPYSQKIGQSEEYRELHMWCET